MHACIQTWIHTSISATHYACMHTYITTYTTHTHISHLSVKSDNYFCIHSKQYQFALPAHNKVISTRNSTRLQTVAILSSILLLSIAAESFLLLPLFLLLLLLIPLRDRYAIRLLRRGRIPPNYDRPFCLHTRRNIGRLCT